MATPQDDDLMGTTRGRSHDVLRKMDASVRMVGMIVLSLICCLVLYVLLLHRGSGESVAIDAIHEEALSQMKDGSRSILPINVSAIRLARLLSFSSRSHLKKQIPHHLFVLYSIVPRLSQISYFGEDGLFFAYHSEGNRTLALFSNSSISPSITDLSPTISGYRWYHQEVDEITGTPHGQAVGRESVAYWTSSWFRSALHSDHHRAQWVIQWGNKRPLFTCIVPVRGSSSRGPRGVVTLGFPVKVLSDFLSPPRQLHGGGIFFATKDRRLVAGYQFLNGLPDRWEPPELTANFQTVDGTDQLQILLHTQNGEANMKNEPIPVVDMNVQGRKYTLHTAHFKLFELPLVSTLAFPRDNTTQLGSKDSKLNWLPPVVVSIILTVMTCFYVAVAYRAVKVTVLLRASLIKQIEATRQAERKSMNKTMAFARTSHDMRTILTIMVGLIENCISSFSHNSQLRSCLMEIKLCVSNLLGFLNSVLDISKIESGKMQLDEVEYDLAQVLEEAVDMFYDPATKKGIEVVLDPCDGTIQKYSRVKGDSERLRQILSNLLSNAVKFTSEGYIVVRAWAKNASSKKLMLPLNEDRHDVNFWHCWSPCYCCNNTSDMDFESLQIDTNEENMIEVVVEVEDTGRGIPKDKHKSVFENFVQVNERDAVNYGGMGLGLGIVQSMVRLMGGEINIVDKAPGAKGTCFRFNIILKAARSSVDFKDNKAGDHELLSVHVGQPPHQSETASTTDLPFGEDFDLEGTCAILVLKAEARTRILKKWMEEHKLKVYTLEDFEKLHSIFETLKPKACSVATTCPEIVSDDGCRTETGGSSSMRKDQELDSATSHHTINDDRVFSSSMSRRIGHLLKVHSFIETLKPKAYSVTTTCSEIVPEDAGDIETSRSSSMRKYQELVAESHHTINDDSITFSSMSRRSGRQRIMSFRAGRYPTNLLFIIEMDYRSDLHLELCKMLSKFILNAQEIRCKVVWIASVTTPSMDVEFLKKSGAPCDLIFHKPLHGSRLYQTLGLVHDFGRRSNSRRATGSNSFRDPQPIPNIGSSATDVKSHEQTCQWPSDSRSTASKVLSLHGDKPLKGVKILLVDDNAVLLRLMTVTLARLGATVEPSKNGEEAFVLVRNSLQGLGHDHKKEMHSPEDVEEKKLYDLILMDCEMPTMNGYEATRKIREEEKHYGDMHIPIIALTAHAMSGEATKSLQSGMDLHLVKPVAQHELVDAIQKVLRI